MEAFGLAAGVLQVAGFGAEVGSTLLRCAKKLHNASKELESIAGQVETTSLSLKRVDELLKDPATKALHTPKLYEDTNTVSQGCHDVFRELDKSVKSYEAKSTSGRMKLLSRTKWLFDSDRLVELGQVLRRYNDVLHLMVSVMTIVEGRRAATKVELQALEADLRVLALSNKDLSDTNKSLAETIATISRAPTSPFLSPGSPATPFAQSRGIPMLQPSMMFNTLVSVPLDSISVQTAPSDKTTDHLQKCMDSVQELAKTIACAMDNWHGRGLLECSDIHGLYAKVSANLEQLPADVECMRCTRRTYKSALHNPPSRASLLSSTCTCDTNPEPAKRRRTSGTPPLNITVTNQTEPSDAVIDTARSSRRNSCNPCLRTQDDKPPFCYADLDLSHTNHVYENGIQTDLARQSFENYIEGYMRPNSSSSMHFYLQTRAEGAARQSLGNMYGRTIFDDCDPCLTTSEPPAIVAEQVVVAAEASDQNPAPHIPRPRPIAATRVERNSVLISSSATQVASQRCGGRVRSSRLNSDARHRCAKMRKMRAPESVNYELDPDEKHENAVDYEEMSDDGLPEEEEVTAHPDVGATDGEDADADFTAQLNGALMEDDIAAADSSGMIGADETAVQNDRMQIDTPSDPPQDRRYCVDRDGYPSDQKQEATDARENSDALDARTSCPPQEQPPPGSVRQGDYYVQSNPYKCTPAQMDTHDMRRPRDAPRDHRDRRDPRYGAQDPRYAHHKQPSRKTHAGSPVLENNSGPGVDIPKLRNTVQDLQPNGLDAQAAAQTSTKASLDRVRSLPSHNVRSSDYAWDQRDYILDLADPQRPLRNGGAGGRQQKPPVPFQCTLCSKRFTRAYNLRSHLRIHTDERPFVCMVCSKGFARQHDRKNHECLHSGEETSVCRLRLEYSHSVSTDPPPEKTSSTVAADENVADDEFGRNEDVRNENGDNVAEDGRVAGQVSAVQALLNRWLDSSASALLLKDDEPAT